MNHGKVVDEVTGRVQSLKVHEEWSSDAIGSEQHRLRMYVHQRVVHHRRQGGAMFQVTAKNCDKQGESSICNRVFLWEMFINSVRKILRE